MLFLFRLYTLEKKRMRERERDYLYTMVTFFPSMIRLVALYGVRSSTSKSFLRLNRSSFFLRWPSSRSLLRKLFLSRFPFSSINSFKLAKRIPSQWLAQLFTPSNQPWWLKTEPIFYNNYIENYPAKSSFLKKNLNEIKKFFQWSIDSYIALPISCISSTILPLPRFPSQKSFSPYLICFIWIPFLFSYPWFQFCQ